MTEKELNEIANEMIDVMLEHNVSVRDAELIIKVNLPMQFQKIKSITSFRKEEKQ